MEAAPNQQEGKPETGAGESNRSERKGSGG